MTDRGVNRVLTLLLLGGALLPPLYLMLFHHATSAPPAATELLIPYGEQLVLFIAAFIVKPLYMTLALLIALLLWKRAEVELIALRRGMLAFFFGEATCALNYLLFNDTSLLMGYWHDYGMVVCFSFVVYALLQALDSRVFNYSAIEKRCVLLPLCNGCYKQGKIPCNLRQLFLYLLPALLVFAALPLTADLKEHPASAMILGSPVLFDHPLSSQLLEARFFPFSAMLLLGLAWLFLLLRKEGGFTPSKLLLAAASGPFVFSLMRLLCYWGFSEQLLWANTWEELSELLFVGGILFIAWKVRAAARQATPPILQTEHP